MFKPYMIPAIAKLDELINSHAKVRFIDKEYNEKEVHLRGYANSDGRLEDVTVRVTDMFCETEYDFEYFVELVLLGQLAKS